VSGGAVVGSRSATVVVSAFASRSTKSIPSFSLRGSLVLLH